MDISFQQKAAHPDYSVQRCGSKSRQIVFLGHVQLEFAFAAPREISQYSRSLIQSSISLN